MSAEIINGKELSARIRLKLKDDIDAFYANTGIKPGLAVIMAGNDPASEIYVKNKEKGCAEVGITSHVVRIPEDTSEDILINSIKELNSRKDIHGILVQLPLPSQLNEKKVLQAVDPKKDVDGFHVINAGGLLSGNSCFVPCTPQGILELIKSVDTDLSGKNAVVIGRSNIVGKPTAMLLLNENATVTVCHSKTKNLTEICKRADILVSAMGSPAIITKEHIKPNAIVIDVGTTRIDGKLKGDVCFEDAVKSAGYITPVPGGVGPMTITMLLKNTFEAAKLYG